MSTPSTDKAAIRQIIRALIAAGHTLAFVYDGEEDVPVTNETEAIDAIMAVDQAHLHVHLPLQPLREQERGYVFFVLGNEPYEVACDYTLNLDPVLGPLTSSWDDDA
jgi:hypothetical protein